MRFVFRSACIGALVLSTGWNPGRSDADPPGYTRDLTQAAEPRPTSEEESSGDFTLSLTRTFSDSTGERLLGLAEATYPPRSLLVRLAVQNAYEMGPDTSKVPLWWSKGVDEARIPYAVTAGAVEHYQNLIELYRKGAFREAGTEPLFSARLLYRATVAPRDTFAVRGKLYNQVYVAHLSLTWTYDDGTFEPLVVARRVVVLTPDGTVLQIEGDGLTRESVAMSSHRGIGRTEQRLH